MKFYHYDFDDPEVIKAWQCPDSELKTMHQMMVKVPLSERDTLRRLISERIQWVDSGFASIPQRYQTVLQSLDPYLRLRSDPYYACILIERVDTDLRAWVTIFRWCTPDGDAKPLNDSTIQVIKCKLQDGDMRRFDSPVHYLAWKRSEAERRQRMNDAASDERIREVIDSLSQKQIDEFAAALRALETGERIVPSGQDADTMNMWADIQHHQPSLPPSQLALNPGHDPNLMYQKEQY